MPDRERSNWVMPDSDPDLDLLIRNATATYANPASNFDLAERILSRVEAEDTKTTTRRWLSWVTVLPIAAAVVLLFMLFASTPAHKPADLSEQAHNVVQPPDKASSLSATKPLENAPASRAVSSRARTRNIAVAISKHSLPKLDTFPAPQTLTPEEQALATYAAHAPEDEQRALIEAHEKLEAPLSIAAITIQPLEPPAPGGN